MNENNLLDIKMVQKDRAADHARLSAGHVR